MKNSFETPHRNQNPEEGGGDFVYKNIETRRKEDINAINNYQNGGLRLNIYVPIAEGTKDVLVDSDLRDGKFEVFPLSNLTGKPLGPYYEMTKEEIISSVNKKYDLDIEKNEKLKSHLIGSQFKNSKEEVITIKDISFDSDELTIEHKGVKFVRSYSKALETSKPLQQHITSIEKLFR